MPDVAKYIFGFCAVWMVTSSINNYIYSKYRYPYKTYYCYDINHHNNRINPENTVLNNTSNNVSNNTSNSTLNPINNINSQHDQSSINSESNQK